MRRVHVSAVFFLCAAMTGCGNSALSADAPSDEALTGDAGADADAAVYRLCPTDRQADDAGWVATSGIDVSEYEYVDWDKAVGDGAMYKYAFARATAGIDHVDTQFVRNWSEMSRVGLLRGAYQYFHAEQAGAPQADLFVQTLTQVGLTAADFPPVLDIEDTVGMPDETVVCRMKTFLARVETLTGRVPIIFTIQKYNQLFDSTFRRYPLWTSNWVANTQTTCPRMLTSWGTWDLWQWTASGTVQGVYTNAASAGAGAPVTKDGNPVVAPCDLNFYNGTSEALASFIAGTASPMPPGNPVGLRSPPPVDASAGTDCSDGCCVLKN